MAGNQVNWGSDREIFERAVIMLLNRKHEDADEFLCPEGRGGDGGVDAVALYGERKIVYQFKFFPEGFSGGFGGRRDQIRRSFRQAEAKEEPSDWVLVVPGLITRSEYAFLKKLFTGYAAKSEKKGLKNRSSGPRIRYMDRGVLDKEIAKHRDLVDYITRDEPLEHRAKIFNQERAELAGGVDDVVDRMRGLRKVIDSKDPDWTIDPRLDGDVVVNVIRAKHKRAPEVSPITFNFSARFEEGSETAGVARRVLGFGARETLHLTSDQIKNFEAHGPEWLITSTEIDSLTVMPVEGESEAREIEIVALNDKGDARGSHIGTATLTTGSQGVILYAQVYGQQLEFGMPRDQDDSGWFRFRSSDEPLSVRDGLAVSQLTLDLHQSPFVMIRVAGRDIAKFGVQEIGRDIVKQAQLTYELADDLDIIERRCPGVRFWIPEELSAIERIEIRNTRLMLEGKVVVHPEVNQLSAHVDAEHVVKTVELLSRGGHLMVEPAPKPAELLGKQVTLPAVRYLLLGATLANRDECDTAIAEGRLDEVHIQVVARDNTLMRMYMHDLQSDPNARLVAVPWGLTGIPQFGLGDLPSNQHPIDRGE